MQNNNSNKEYIEIQDEAMSYLNHEALRSQLANISGVPDREYRVIDANNVFVFSKFSNEVLENAIDKDAQTLANLALRMLPSSYMTPSQAIKYGIRPCPYEVQEVKGGFKIKHKIFKSLIPGLFATKEELDEVLASLLIGNIHGGKGDFVYKGQPMINEFQLNTKLSSLPIKPRLETVVTTNAPSFAILSKTEYTEGFDAITNSLFNSIKSLEATWEKENNNTESFVFQKISDIWQLIQSLDLSHLQLGNEFNNNPDNAESISLLRVTYPELAQLSDASLFYLYDEYQASCNYLNSWSIYREDHFILFLLGELLSSKNLDLDGFKKIRVGIVIAYGLLQNLSEKEAMILGKEWYNYEQELTIITQYVAAVMQFLAEDKNTQHLQGDKIYNPSDIFRVGRKLIKQ